MGLPETQSVSSGSPILLTGATGQVGSALLPLLQQFGRVIAPDRRMLDLARPEDVDAFVRDTKPRWIINPAAYTAVDKAEEEPAHAEVINAQAPHALGVAAARLRIPVVHFSTDYVFDGSGTKPWKESDPTGPLGVYGKTKLAGETALPSTGAAHVIFRTSWVYSPAGKNFPLKILELARTRNELRIVADQHGAPTSASNLARLTVHLMRQTEQRAVVEGSTPAEVLRRSQGVYHAADSGETTWYGFAQKFLALAAQAEPHQTFARLVPISTADFATRAQRPANSRLDCTRLTRDLGYTMQPWAIAAEEVLRQTLTPSDATRNFVSTAAD